MPQGREHGRPVECLPKELLEQTWDFTESLVVPKIPGSIQTRVFLNTVVAEYKAFISFRIMRFATTNYDYYIETSGNARIFFGDIALECLPTNITFLIMKIKGSCTF